MEGTGGFCWAVGLSGWAGMGDGGGSIRVVTESIVGGHRAE